MHKNIKDIILQIKVNITVIVIAEIWLSLNLDIISFKWKYDCEIQ